MHSQFWYLSSNTCTFKDRSLVRKLLLQTDNKYANTWYGYNIYRIHCGVYRKDDVLEENWGWKWEWGAFSIPGYTNIGWEA